MSADLLDAQLRRVDRLWSRYEETGDLNLMVAAQEADRLYLRMREREATS